MFVVVAFQTIAQQNISDVRKLSEGETVTITGIITNGNELGLIRYIQDTTAGLAIYDEKLDNTKRGDSITVTGEIDVYNSLFEIKNVSTLTVHTSGNKLPAPRILTIDEIGEDYEGQLIKIENIECEKAGSAFSGGSNYKFSDGTKTGEFRINIGSPIINQVIPSGRISLVAICSQYSRENNDTRDGYQLLPRDMDDFISGSSVNITSPVTVGGISKNSISLGWVTDSGSFPFVRYGNSNSKDSLVNYKTGDSTTSDEYNMHMVEITGLKPSQIVYAQVFSVFETDTAFSYIGAYISESNSSGNTRVYFNTPVNETLATENIENNIENAMEDTLSAFINRAEISIDFCIYNFNNKIISDALNAAQNRGVKIRLITCESTSHSSINDLNSEIPVLERPEIQEGGIMHNKFAIFDSNSADANKAWVWSGSTNLTSGQLLSDANNIIFIQDQSLAKTYKIEFEEMWGNTGNQPNESNSKFGAAKSDNTPHEFIIGGNRVQSYFSPSDGTNQKIIDAINTAENDLNVETMLITRTDLANAISDAKQRGVEVHVITNRENDNSDAVNDILNAALPTGKFIFDNSASGTLHHKLAIVDANFAASDPLVITGSHNWSNSANDRNDENTLIIHNAEIANQYFQQFGYRFAENGGDLVVSVENIEIENIMVYPNPTIGKVTVTSKQLIKNIQLFSLAGVKIKEINSNNSNQYEIDFTTFKSGLYILKVQTKNEKSNTYKIIKK